LAAAVAALWRRLDAVMVAAAAAWRQCGSGSGSMAAAAVAAAVAALVAAAVAAVIAAAWRSAAALLTKGTKRDFYFFSLDFLPFLRCGGNFFPSQ
jgi:hypothetical protein